MDTYYNINEESIDNLAKYISKYMKIDLQEANSLIYEEYDLIESLLPMYKKPKDIAKSFIRELNSLYQIA